MRLKWIIWLAPAALLLTGCTSSVQTSGTVSSYGHVGYYSYVGYPYYDCYPSAVWYPYYSMYWNSFADPYCYGYYYGPVYSCSWYYRNAWYAGSRPHYRNPHLVYGDRRDNRHDGYRQHPDRTDQPPVRQKRVLTPVSSTAPTRPVFANQQPVDARHQTVRTQRTVSGQPERSRPASPPPAPRPTPPAPPPSGSSSQGSYSNNQVATTSGTSTYSNSSSSYRQTSSGSSRSSSDSGTRSYSRQRPAERDSR